MEQFARVALSRLASLVAFHSLLAGCGGEPPDLPASPEEQAAPRKAPPIPPARAPERQTSRAIAWTAAGDLALFDGESGAVIASSLGGHLGGARDLAIDEEGSRALVFEGNDDATWGELATYSLDGSSPIGARVHRAYVDGDARVLAVPHGIAVFEDGDGPRWKVLRDDGEETLGIAMPRPASITMRRQGEGWRIGALAYVDGEAARPTLEIDGAYERRGSLGALPNDPLALASSNPPCARLVHISRDADVILDVAPKGLALTRIHAGDAGETAIARLDAPPHRIEAAILAGDDLLAVLTSGPSRIVFIALEGREHIGVRAVVDLPGQVRVEDRFFSRDLALVGAKLFAGTDAGIFAIEVSDASDAGSAFSAAIDPSFDGSALRGPIAAPP